MSTNWKVSGNLPCPTINCIMACLTLESFCNNFSKIDWILQKYYRKLVKPFWLYILVRWATPDLLSYAWHCYNLLYTWPSYKVDWDKLFYEKKYKKDKVTSLTSGSQPFLGATHILGMKNWTHILNVLTNKCQITCTNI